MTLWVVSVFCEPLSTERDFVRQIDLSGSDAPPLGQCGGAAFLVELTAGEVAFEDEVIADVGMDGGEFLQGFHPAKPEHRSLARSLARVFGRGGDSPPPGC